MLKEWSNLSHVWNKIQYKRTRDSQDTRTAVEDRL